MAQTLRKPRQTVATMPQAHHNVGKATPLVRFYQDQSPGGREDTTPPGPVALAEPEEGLGERRRGTSAQASPDSPT